MRRTSVACSTPDGPIADLVEEYLEDRRTEVRHGNLSPRSWRAYANRLRGVLLPWCGRAGLSTVGQLDDAALERFTRSVSERHPRGGAAALSPLSMAAYLRSVRQMLRWATSREGAGRATTGTAVVPHVPERALIVLGRHEIARLEAAAPTERDRLIIRLMADTGMRLGELVSLRLTDVVTRPREPYVRVHGQGSTARLVPVTAALMRRLVHHIASRPQDATSDRVFIALRRNRHGAYRPLEASGIEQLCKLVGERAGLPAYRVHPDALRYAFITHGLSRNMNPVVLREVVGHRMLRMRDTQYSHTDISTKHAAMMRLLTDGDNPRVSRPRGDRPRGSVTRMARRSA